MIWGSLVYAATQWLVIVVLARLGTPEDIGLFTLASALSVPMLALSQLSLRQVFITDAANRYDFSDFVILRCGTTAIACLTVVLLGVVLGYRDEPLAAIIAVGIGRGFESISDIYYAPLHKKNRLDVVSVLLMIRGILGVFLVSLTFATTRSIGLASAAFAVACALATAVAHMQSTRVDLWRRTNRRGRWTSRYLTSLAARGLPLGAAQLLVSVNGNMPRYVLERFGGATLLGQYAVLEHFVAAGSLVVNSIGQAATPRLAASHAENDGRQFWTLTVRVLLLASIVGIAGLTLAITYGGQLVLSIYGPGFSLAIAAFPYVMVAALFAFLSSVLGYAMTARSVFIAQIPLFIAVAFVNGLVGFSFVHDWGISGAVAGTIAASIVQLFASAAILASSHGPHRYGRRRK